MTFHLTPELSRAFRRGQIEQDDLIQVVFDHLPAVCPHCRAGFAALAEEEGSPVVAWRLAAFETLLAHYEPEVRESEERAAADVRRLLALPPAERKGTLLRAHRRFRGVTFVGLLLDEQERHLHVNPAMAYHWAELAWTAACQSPRMPADLLALTLSQMANSRRAAGDLRSAEEYFRQVRYLVARHPVTDLSVLARITYLEGSLRKDQQEFAKSRKLLDRAAMLHRLLGKPEDLAQVFLTMADACFYQGATGRAIAKVRKALALLDRKANLRLYLWARHNLGVYLAEEGRFDEVVALLAEDSPAYREHFEPVDLLRLSWLEGRIAAGQGRSADAEAILGATRDGLLKEGMGYSAAMVSLDLALLYARTGRAGELKRLAEEIGPIFSAQDVHREAIAALLLFQEGARQETLTLRTLEALADYLRDARNDASRRFEAPPAG